MLGKYNKVNGRSVIQEIIILIVFGYMLTTNNKTPKHFNFIYHYVAANIVLQNKVIIHHTKVISKPLRTLDNSFFIKIYFIRMAKLYICIVLINIRNIYVKYSRSGPINYKIVFYESLL